MMKKKLDFNKILIFSILIIVPFMVSFMYISHKEYKLYVKNFNNKISGIIQEITKKYPNTDINEIINILNNPNIEQKDIFKNYGINIDKESIIESNNIIYKRYLIINLSLFFIFFSMILIIFIKYNKQQITSIKNITNYIQEINKMNYKLDIQDNSEGELSILKNELYKITVMLKETAENSKKDKINLKNSLSDISHQLKTPLTSIMIMLDNITDSKNMDGNLKEEFIKNIKREIINVKFLTEAILKLSKLESNTVEFIKKDVKIKDIINESIKNVEILCDLKNIHIIVNGDDKEKIICDFKWQVEAITNMLKNAVEHSKQNSKILINFSQNKIYSEIQIQDFGKGINKEDLQHIFDRFYKGKNSGSESIGIGLALAKSIIESNEGYVTVKSELNKGSTFIIKYFNTKRNDKNVFCKTWKI